MGPDAREILFGLTNNFNLFSQLSNHPNLMPSIIALLFCSVFIVFLFIRDLKNNPDLSRSLWIPLIWLFIASSRSFSGWFHLGPAQTQILDAYSEGNSFDRNFLLLLIALAIVAVVKRKLHWYEIFQRNRLLFLFVLYCLLSIMWSEFPFIALKRWVRFAGMVPMVVVVLSEHSPIDAIAAILRRCSYLLVTLSVLFVRYLPDLGRYYNPWTNEVAYCGVGTNKNELGLLSFVAGIFFFWDILRKSRQKGNFLKSMDTWTTLFLWLLTIYLLRIADSSTATLCTIIGSLIILVTYIPSIKNNPRTVGYKILSGSIVFFALQIIFNINDVIIRALGRNPTLTGRTDLWQILLKMGTNPLLGTGYESFWTKNRLSLVWSSGHHALQAHNGYLDAYLNLGLIGVVFFIALLMRLFQIITREMPAGFALNQLKLVFLIVYALFNYSEAAFPRPGIMLFIFFLFILDIPKDDSRSPLKNESNKNSPDVL
jgi:exopolysaccharide production protein ExoQ